MEKNLSPGIGLSLMSQYYPCYKAPPDFQRTLETEEYRSILQFVKKSGFDRVFAQPEPFSPGENLIPDFRKKNPFDWD
jgi:putative pyruvate formate lyase activating enzyme